MCTRFTWPLIFLLSTTAHEIGDSHSDSAWSYLTTPLPIGLSDMDEVVLLFGTQKRIVLTGGCDAPNGNQFNSGGYFECSALSNRTLAFDPVRHVEGHWNGEFEFLASMPRARARHVSTVVAMGDMCLIGGRDEMDSLIAEIDCYDPNTNTWSTPTSLPEEFLTSDGAAFTQGNVTYLIGGYDAEYNALDNVTLMDTSDWNNIQFSVGPPLLQPRGDVDAVTVNGDTYVSGGYTHLNNYSLPFDSVEVLNYDSQKWSLVDDLNEERGDKQLVALHGKIYAMGGETKIQDTDNSTSTVLAQVGEKSIVLDTVEVFDAASSNGYGRREWITLEDMPAPLFRFAAAEWEIDSTEGVIFVFGGQVGFDPDCECFRTVDTILVFDPHVALEKEAGTSAVVNSASLFDGLRTIGYCLSLFVLMFS